MANLEHKGSLQEAEADGIENDYLHEVLELQTRLALESHQLALESQSRAEANEKISKLRERIQFAVVSGDVGVCRGLLELEIRRWSVFFVCMFSKILI